MYGLVMLVRNQETGFLHPIIYVEYDRTMYFTGCRGVKVLYKSVFFHNEGFLSYRGAHNWIDKNASSHLARLGVTRAFEDTRDSIRWDGQGQPPQTQNRMIVTAIKKSKLIEV